MAHQEVSVVSTMKNMNMLEKFHGSGKRGFIVAAVTMVIGCGLCSGEENERAVPKEPKAVPAEPKKPKKVDPAEAKRIEKESIVAIQKIAGKVGLKPLDVNLAGTKVTDAGLVHLKGMTGLQELYLNGTKVTDAGLVHLKGLTELQWLDLDNTEVTGAGVRMLRAALPKCEILP
jgi:hypothetical protein